MAQGSEADLETRLAELEGLFHNFIILFKTFITAYNAHLHSGVTAGGANSGAPTATVSNTSDYA